MFDIGWSEMAVIAIVALVVLGPKELPNALKTAAQWMRTARKLAREFQSGVDQIVREAELDEARKTVQQATQLNLGKEIEKAVDPTGETKRLINTDPAKALPAGTAGNGAAPATPSVTTPTPVTSQLSGSSAPAPSAPAAAPSPAPPAAASTPTAEPATAASGEPRP
jgi:sec-independent protein translocase protein TatB